MKIHVQGNWSWLKQDFLGVDRGCCCYVNVIVIMERHPILICRLKLSPAPPLFIAKELGGWFSLLKQLNLTCAPTPNLFFAIIIAFQPPPVDPHYSPCLKPLNSLSAMDGRDRPLNN
jgi:hypothetical protein